MIEQNFGAHSLRHLLGLMRQMSSHQLIVHLEQVSFLWQLLPTAKAGRSKDHETIFMMCFMGATTDDERFFH